MKRFAITIVGLFLLCASAAAETDWRIEVFDKAQTLFTAFDQNEGRLMKALEPRVGEFYSAWIALQNSNRQVGRFVFLRRLNDDPQSIDWKDPWVWSSGLQSTAEAEQLAEKDQVFKTLYDDYLAKKAAIRKLKDLNKLRNEVYKRNKSDFIQFENDLERDLRLLQVEINEKLANQGLQRICKTLRVSQTR